jgi:hypothetical protein
MSPASKLFHFGFENEVLHHARKWQYLHARKWQYAVNHFHLAIFITHQLEYR